MTSTVRRPRDPELEALAVRPARPQDAAEVAGLIRSAEDLRQVSPDETFPLTEATVRHWIEHRRAGYVLEQRGRILGYAELVDDARVAHRVWVGHMMVAPGRRGLGLGRRLVSALLRAAELDRDAHEVAISAFEDNQRALRCYRGCGFRDRATHRVNERRLVEMRYPVPGRRSLAPMPVAIGLLGMTAAVVLAVGGPRVWSALVALPTIALTALAAVAFHGIVPRRRDRGIARGLRLVAYPATVGATALAVLALLSLATEVGMTRAVLTVLAAIGLGTTALAVHVGLGERMRGSGNG